MRITSSWNSANSFLYKPVHQTAGKQSPHHLGMTRGRWVSSAFWGHGSTDHLKRSLTGPRQVLHKEIDRSLQNTLQYTPRNKEPPNSLGSHKRTCDRKYCTEFHQRLLGQHTAHCSKYQEKEINNPSLLASSLLVNDPGHIQHSAARNNQVLAFARASLCLSDLWACQCQIHIS